MLTRLKTALTQRWLWLYCLLPFAVTRVLLVIVGYVSLGLVPDPGRPEHTFKGWWATPIRWLDIWIRWDSSWYMTIVRNNYVQNGDLQTSASNWPFFPAYPLLVKFLSIVSPLRDTDFNVLMTGLLVSNLALLGSVILLYRLVLEENDDPQSARRSVWCLLLFPTSFFLSSFYAEGLFLFLSVAAFYAISKRAWAVASLLGCLLALTKSIGILFFVPLIWSYAESIKWDPRGIRPVVAWFAVIPLGVLAFLVHAQAVTGNLWAPFIAHAAWGKILSAPWDTFLNPAWGNTYYHYFEQVLALLIVPACWLMAIRLAPRYSLYACLLVAPMLFSGNLSGLGRHCALLFPLFMLLGQTRDVRLARATQVALLVILVVIMAGWSQFYAIV